MTEFTATGNDLKEQDAIKCIQPFRNRFTEAHLEFTCDAAFPLALAPDLLHRFWAYPFWSKL
ncbi:hypothetical protein QUB56_25225 [Microcoleus sp. AR_TQ3_B6]|uniref:hypothetical protein n=1 Tax=Microcoleus sp. AR_TQ3_B6 TaxID=3055284 RepID=UPI002FD405AA